MIRLEEYRSAVIDLEPQDLGQLLRLVKASAETQGTALLESLTPTGTPNRYEVRPGLYVGRLGLPSGLTVDIQSRFAFEDVIELLRLSGQLPLFRERLAAEQEATPFIVEAIAMAFTREVQRIAGRGLAKGYRKFVFMQPPYPGVPDVSLHLRRLGGRADRLATRARRISTDVALNRALALVVDILGRVPLPRSITASLSRLLPHFGGVRRVPMTSHDVASIELTNLTRRYEQALALAEVVLRGQSLAPRATGLAGGSLAFYMPKVWESFVHKAVQLAWGPAFRVQAGYNFDLTDEGEMSSIADVVVWDGDRIAALYDAKYKWGNQAPSAGDMYQMVAYCRRLSLPEATLVYPAPTAERTLSVKGTRVRVVGLKPGDHRILAPAADAEAATA